MENSEPSNAVAPSRPSNAVDDAAPSGPSKVVGDTTPSRPSKNVFDLLPTEIVYLILDMATTNQDVVTFNSVNNTCSRFRSNISIMTIIKKKKKNRILPRIYLDYYDNVLERLPRRGNKMKVTINKLSRHFRPGSGAVESV